MKIKRLQFLNRTIHVGVQAEASSLTHNISLFPGGYYLLEHRGSQRSYLVHASLAVAELEQEEADNAGDAADAPGAIPRRGAPTKKPAPVPPG